VRHVTYGSPAVSRRPPFRPKAHAYRSRIAGVLSAGRREAGTVQRLLSGERTVALVELYTSEGCKQLPAADRWAFRSRGLAAMCRNAWWPLSLHVDYWDYIAGKSVRQRRFSARQESSRSSSARRLCTRPGAAPRPGFQAVEAVFSTRRWPDQCAGRPRRVLHWRIRSMGVQAMEVRRAGRTA